MTVEELIKKLEALKDKSVPVVLAEWSIQNPMMGKCDLTANRIVSQPHRLVIITD